MARLDKAEIATRLYNRLRLCAGWREDEIAADRRYALNDYHQRPNGTEVAGRAQTVSGDISSMVESNLASITESLSDDDLVEIAANGAADVEQAQLEADALTHFCMKANAGRYHLAAAIKDILLLRNGWLKIYCERTYSTDTQDYEGVSPEALQEMTTPDPHKQYTILRYDPEARTLRLKTTTETKLFRFEYVPTENVLYPRDYGGCDFAALQEIPIIAEIHVEARSDVLAKFPKAKKIIEVMPEHSVKVENSSNARDPRSTPEYQHGADKSTENVLWYEVHAQLDIDGDGIAERVRVCMTNDKQVLLIEPFRLQPLVTGQCFLAPGRVTGISLWDKLRQNQAKTTQLERALLDNVNATSRPRTAHLDGRVNSEDLADGRVDGSVRVKATVPRVSDALMPIVVPDTSMGIKSALEFMHKNRKELGGSALDMASSEMQLGRGVGSEGLDRAYSVAEQLAAHMCRNIAQTLVRSAYLLAHATLREHYDYDVPIYRDGDFVEVNPTRWQPRTRLSVKVGMSPGERSRMVAALDFIIIKQIEMARENMEDVLVNVQGFHSALLDRSRIAGVPTPERYFVDPRSDSAKQAIADKQASAEQMRKMQERLVAQAVELEQLGVAFQKYKTDAELQFKYWAERQENIRTEAEIAGRATVELLKDGGESNEPQDDSGQSETDGDVDNGNIESTQE